MILTAVVIVSGQADEMGCQSIFETIFNLPISRFVGSLACLSAHSPLAPAALASPWLTRAHRTIRYISMPSTSPPPPITTPLPLPHNTPPPVPIPGDVLVSISIDPPPCMTLPPTFILHRTTLPQTTSPVLPVSLSLAPLNRRPRPRHDTPLQ